MDRSHKWTEAQRAAAEAKERETEAQPSPETLPQRWKPEAELDALFEPEAAPLAVPPQAAALIEEAAKLGVNGIDEALTALTKLFGGDTIPAPSRVEQVSSLNLEYNNLVAGELLPLDWMRPDQINLLSLAHWGLEQGLRWRNPTGGVSQQALEDTVLAMWDWAPQNALDFIQGTPPDQAFLLDPKNSALESAIVVLESIMYRIGASDPT